MHYNKACQPHKAVSRERGRYAMHLARFEHEEDDYGPVLVATNGRILAVVPVTDCENDTAPSWIPPEALKEAAKGRGQEAELSVNGSIRAVGKLATVEFPAIEDPGAFPSWRDMLRHLHAPEPVPVIGLNPHLLALAAEAIGVGKTEAVRLEFHGPQSPVLVRPVGVWNQAFALVMPCNLTP